MQQWIVEEESHRVRLDVFVAKHVPELSRSSIQKLCDQEQVLVDGKPQGSNYKVKTDQKITLQYDLAELKDIPKIDLPILYEDEDCLVLNKSIGVLTHSKGMFNPEGTVATFIEPYLKGIEGERAGIVHRLDRATSGVIIAAKNAEAQSWLQKQFGQRRVKKTYVAVIEGQLDPNSAVIEVPIERNPKKPQTFRAGTNGKDAITTYKTLQSNEDYSTLELSPQTGRTHQLRVHLKYLDHPIVGDTLYGGKEADRLYLHAHKLELTLPNRERKVFIAPVPSEFKAIMK
jgi:23S rRNA pseudouridine1911/1915/1917 synthase